tara:strand:+ start:14659 stop:15198 length:540 start_codon:yes stop_codon:yes gene_type:complete
MLEKLKEEIKKNKKPILFITKMLGLYLIFQFFYDYIISPYTEVDAYLINSIIGTAESGLKFLKYELLPSNSIYKYHMGIYGTTGVIIGNPCDGLSLFILFTSFLIVFKGKLWFKALFTFLGIFLIHLLNVGRVMALAIIVKYYPETLDFHHSYTFTLFIYVCIFLLWVLRIKIYQKHQL